MSGGTARYLSVPPPLERAFTARSNAQGVWTMTNLPQEGRAHFEIVDPRFYASQFSVQLRAGGATAAPIRVFAGATVSGRVRLPNGKPAAGMTIYAGGMPSRRATTEADGSYRVAGLGTTTARVVVYDSSNAWVAPVVWGLRTRLGTTTRVPDIVLTRGSVLQGRVVDAVTGAPVPGASLTAHFDWRKTPHDTGNFAFARSDVQGRYALRVLPGPGTLEVHDYMPTGTGHQPQSDLLYNIGNAQTATLTVRMTPALALSGTARDETGQVVRDAVIWVQAIGRVSRSMSREFLAKVVDGRWRVTGLPRTTVKLDSRGKWEVVSPQRLTLPVKGPIGVTLRRVDFSPLSANVVTSDGTAISNVEVTAIAAVNTRSGDFHRTRTDARGISCFVMCAVMRK